MAELIAESIEPPFLWEPFTRGRKAYREFNLKWVGRVCPQIQYNEHH